MSTSTHRVAAAVAAVLALTLAACSGNTDTPAAAGSSTATTSTMTTNQAPTGPSSTTPGQGSATGASGQYGPGMMGGGTLAGSTAAGMMGGDPNYHYSAPTCAAPTSLPGSTVTVVLGDMGMTQMMSGTAPLGSHMMLRATPATVPAGQVSLVASNMGWRTHELVILPLAADAAAGQRVPGPDGKVDEAGSLGEASASCAEGSGDGNQCRNGGLDHSDPYPGPLRTGLQPGEPLRRRHVPGIGCHLIPADAPLPSLRTGPHPVTGRSQATKFAPLQYAAVPVLGIRLGLFDDRPLRQAGHG